MTKNLFLLLSLVSINFLANSITYEVIPTTDPENIAVKEISDVVTNGYDSEGHSITLHHTETHVKHLTPYEAFDIGVRYHVYSLVRAAICKLEHHHKTIDVSESIVVLCDNIHSANFSKKIGYGIGGVTAACSLFPWLSDWRRVTEITRRANQVVVKYEDGTIWEKIGCSAFIAALGGIICWISNCRYNNAVNESMDVLRLLLNSRACVIIHPIIVERALIDILPLLTHGARETVSQYLARKPEHF